MADIVVLECLFESWPGNFSGGIPGGSLSANKNFIAQILLT